MKEINFSMTLHSTSCSFKGDVLYTYNTSLTTSYFSLDWCNGNELLVLPLHFFLKSSSLADITFSCTISCFIWSVISELFISKHYIFFSSLANLATESFIMICWALSDLIIIFASLLDDSKAESNLLNTFILTYIRSLHSNYSCLLKIDLAQVFHCYCPTTTIESYLDSDWTIKPMLFWTALMITVA